MAELIPTIVFYLFALTVIGSAAAVIISKNPVHSVFFLILAFFNSAGLFVLLGAEYIAMTLVIVYVGAVAVLFLFVVMMLDINFAELRQGFQKYLPMGLAVAGIVLFELLFVFSISLNAPADIMEATHATPDPAEITNTQAIGDILYTWYIYPFQMAGVVLFIAMIGAIVLTLRTRPGVRKQNISQQLARKREESMEIVKIKPGEGA
ncbi:MAG: NADH-quinone oxidoreductase subunit J [Rickettsiales bacterium]